MCGIVGFTGGKQAAPILLDGLSKHFEYIRKFKENERLIDVVAEDDVKEAMKDLKERFIEKGVEL